MALKNQKGLLDYCLNNAALAVFITGNILKTLYALLLITISTQAFCASENDYFIAAMKHQIPMMGYSFEVIDKGLSQKCGKRPTVNYLRLVSQTKEFVMAQALPKTMADEQLEACILITPCEN
jgi:hypothetical protein